MVDMVEALGAFSQEVDRRQPKEVQLKGVVAQVNW